MKNGKIYKYQFEEGYCQAAASGTSDSFTFCYYDLDHLGNIRQVTEDDGSKKGEVIQTMNYYPFGAEFCDNSTKNYTQKHKYNGKEFDNMHGLNSYDYGARQYNPVTARWDRIDPLCEKYYNVSPYVYCVNNPVMCIDPDGRDWILSTGDKVYWYGGDVGDYSQLCYTFNATSGNIDYQEARFQNLKDKGPTPEGDYHINLSPDPERVAKADSRSGELLRNTEGGIEKIPEFVDNPNRPGWGWTYNDWGENRAALTPDKVTGAKNSERVNNSYYFHDSAKGYTHGCTEVDPELFTRLKEYRNAGNIRIDVVVKYDNPNHKTNGGTKHD